MVGVAGSQSQSLMCQFEGTDTAKTSTLFYTNRKNGLTTQHLMFFSCFFK